MPIAEVDSEGRVRYANASAERLFPDLRAVGAAHPWLAGWGEVARVFREGGATSHQRVVDVGEASYQQSMYYVGETECVRIYGADVTERRRAEEALRKSEARFRTLFDTMSEGFCVNEIICDRGGAPRDFRYLQLNPVFERHTGLAAAEIRGRTLLELFPAAEPTWIER